MKRKLRLWQIGGFATSVLGGTLLHFLYALLGKAVWIAPFSAINESTWEHMKLLFWPMFIFAIVQSFFFGDQNNFWCIKLRGSLLGLTLIPVLFYTYNGVIGKSPDFINIAIFVISAAIAYIWETHQLNTNDLSCKNPKFSLLLLCVITVMFVLFTFRTPELAIFNDPLTGTYGK
ncbi:MAG: hypothetical protein J6V93_04940 [Clostridia bacterium]|nr:hypothetical protein [Clostridia bacterium]